MHISLKRHRTIVAVLVVLLATLFVIGVLAFLDVGIFKHERVAAPVTPGEVSVDTASSTKFLVDEEVVVIKAATAKAEIVLPIKRTLFEYVQVTDGCAVHFVGECLNVRSGPGIDFPVITQLRNGIILKVGGEVERDGLTWYKIVFDEFVRYPNRIKGDWYIAAPYVRVLLDEGEKTSWEDGTATTSKRIVVNRTKQTLTAYNGDTIFMDIAVSTGLELSPTPRGEFTIFKKTPSRYMQGPIPGVAEQYYDMPGVPWNLYFTHGGAVIHGTYWHDSFGTAYSHGCVNLPPDQAEKLYHFATLGTKVIVVD
jgi:hypothetical protein